MESTTIGEWKRIDASVRGGLHEAIRLINELLGRSLISVTIYGEAVTGGFDRRQHTVQSALVLQAVELATLRYLATYGPRLGKLGMTSPIVVTPKYIQNSLDTFPLEWLEIQQQGVTVLGSDHFASLTLEPAHVRLQCERELKRTLMGLRQALLAATAKESAVAMIERDAMDTVLRTLRGMLWLKGRREHQPVLRVLDEVEQQVGCRLEGLRAALNQTARHDWTEFDRLYQDVEVLMEKANAT